MGGGGSRLPVPGSAHVMFALLLQIVVEIQYDIWGSSVVECLTRDRRAAVSSHTWGSLRSGP